MPRIVGLTGGIATGKSTVSALWRASGATIIDADAIARDVVRPGRPAYLLIRRHFGPRVINADGTLNRPALGNIVFSDAKQRAALNRRIHPFIICSMFTKLFVATVICWRRVVVLDAPLLFESGTLVPICSRIVVVTASRDTQIARILTRDADKGLTEADAENRINAQMPLEQKAAKAHFVIDNSGSREELKRNASRVLTDLEPSNRSEFLFRTVVCAVAVKLMSSVAAVMSRP